MGIGLNTKFGTSFRIPRTYKIAQNPFFKKHIIIIPLLFFSKKSLKDLSSSLSNYSK